jgi:hypothetical protein
VQLFQVAHGVQAIVHLVAEAGLAAGAGLHLAEVGVTERQVEAQVTNAAANRAVRVAGQIGGRGVSVR